MSEPNIHVGAGVETLTPTGTQYSAVFVLSGPDGTRAVFNDPDDPDYVGVIKEITGLDSPEVRESAEDLSQLDGGAHGDFFYGRRPITITGMLLNPPTMHDRNERETKLRRASNAMRADATLSWTLAGGIEQYVNVRRQQPLRVTGMWQKEFQLPLVAADPLIYEAGDVNSMEFSSVTGNTVVVEGSAPVPFKAVIEGGPASIEGAVLENLTTGKQLKIDASFTSGTDHFLVLDTSLRTAVMTNEFGANERSVYSKFDYVNSEWFTLQPGENLLQLTSDQKVWSFRGASAYYPSDTSVPWEGPLDVTLDGTSTRVIHGADDYPMPFPLFVWGESASGGTDATHTPTGPVYTATARFTVNAPTPYTKVHFRAYWTADAATAPTSSPSNYESESVVSEVLSPGDYFLTLPMLIPPTGKEYLRLLTGAQSVQEDGSALTTGYNDNDITYHNVTLSQYGAGGIVTWRNAWI